MGFRDEEGAKQARLQALSNELADRERRLAETDALLAEREAKLAHKTRQLEEARLEADDVSRATAHLDALRARAPKPIPPDASGAEAHSERRAVELSSVSVFGNVDVISLGVLAGVPTMLATFYLGVSLGSAFAWLPPLTLLTFLASVRWGGRAWAGRQWNEEGAWARSRPYDLQGYPALLGTPASGITHSELTFLDGDSHQVLELTLDFADDADAPDDLPRIIAGFDSELEPGRAVSLGERLGMDEDDADRAPHSATFHRPSPVSYRTSKAGSRFVETEHNRAVRAWVRRFDRDVLGPLHRGHGLTRAKIRLR